MRIHVFFFVFLFLFHFRNEVSSSFSGTCSSYPSNCIVVKRFDTFETPSFWSVYDASYTGGLTVETVSTGYCGAIPVLQCIQRTFVVKSVFVYGCSTNRQITEVW